MKTIIVDTNMLMVPFQFKVDIFEEFDRLIDEKYELVTLDNIIKELEKLSKGRTKDSFAAKLGLKLVKAKDIKVIKTKQESADKSLLDLADKDTIIATNDKTLIRKLKKDKRKILRLKQKKYLVLI